MPKDPGDTPVNDAYGQLIAMLPERVWYLSSNGLDMWCRLPYGFFFSSSAAATRFARDMDVDMELSPVGIDAKELISDAGFGVLRTQNLTRLFVDPSVDPESGEVYGPIVRLAELN